MPPDLRAHFDRFLAVSDRIISGLSESRDPYGDAMRLLDELENLNREIAARRGVRLPELRGAR